MCCFLFLLIHSLTFAQKSGRQKASAEPAYANQLFKDRNYIQALDEFKILWEQDSNDLNYSRKLAICYLNTNIDKEKARSLLLKVTANSKTEGQNWYDLGRACQYSFRFEEAIIAFQKYLDNKPRKDNNALSAQRQIEMCNNAMALLEHPLEVDFENAGPAVNSSFPDYNPFVSADGNMLVFTSKREGNLGGLADYDGYPTSDIFLTEKEAQTWKKPKRLSPPLNTNFVDECTWLAGDGNQLMLYQVNPAVENEILLTTRKGKNFQKAVSPGSQVNLQKTVTSSGCLSADGQTLFFASDRAGGFGKSDIYYCRKAGKAWSAPINAGPNINTAYDEDFPAIGPDQKFIFFASQGHNSMGGFDIFFAGWYAENATFDKAVNIGYPVNTPENNLSISFTNQYESAWISARRKEGMGDLDIYHITLNNFKPSLNGTKTR